MKVTVPSGCTGLDMADGTRYNAPRQGGHIDVLPQHAAAITKSWYGPTGVIATSETYGLGTKKGRRCQPCKRLWNVWNHTCPKCGQETEEEQQ